MSESKFTFKETEKLVVTRSRPVSLEQVRTIRSLPGNNYFDVGGCFLDPCTAARLRIKSIDPNVVTLIRGHIEIDIKPANLMVSRLCRSGTKIRNLKKELDSRAATYWCQLGVLLKAQAEGKIKPLRNSGITQFFLLCGDSKVHAIGLQWFGTLEEGGWDIFLSREKNTPRCPASYAVVSH